MAGTGITQFPNLIIHIDTMERVGEDIIIYILDFIEPIEHRRLLTNKWSLKMLIKRRQWRVCEECGKLWLPNEYHVNYWGVKCNC